MVLGHREKVSDLYQEIGMIKVGDTIEIKKEIYNNIENNNVQNIINDIKHEFPLFVKKILPCQYMSADAGCKECPGAINVTSGCYSFLDGMYFVETIRNDWDN